jgi:hypothetical protein
MDCMAQVEECLLLPVAQVVEHLSSKTESLSSSPSTTKKKKVLSPEFKIQFHQRNKKLKRSHVQSPGAWEFRKDQLLVTSTCNCPGLWQTEATQTEWVAREGKWGLQVCGQGTNAPKFALSYTHMHTESQLRRNTETVGRSGSVWKPSSYKLCGMTLGK